VIKLVIGLILVGVVIGCSILAPERELAQLEKEITSEKYAEVKKVNADLASIDGVLTSYPINDIFVALKNAEPVGCTLTNIEFNCRVTLDSEVNVQKYIQLYIACRRKGWKLMGIWSYILSVYLDTKIQS